MVKIPDFSNFEFSKLLLFRKMVLVQDHSHLPNGALLIRVLFSFLPCLSTSGDHIEFGSGHSDRQTYGYFSRAPDSASKFFFCNCNRPGNKFGDTICPEARVVMCRVFLRQQNRLMRLSILVHIAEVTSGKYAALPFAAEGYPSAVAGPAMPGFAFFAVDLQPLRFHLSGFL